METAKVFITKLKKDIEAGLYDKHLTLPFMTRNLLISAVEGKIQRLIESNGTPILTDAELMKLIEDTKETAGVTYHLFNKYGFLEPDAEGKIGLSKKGQLALREAIRM